MKFLLKSCLVVCLLLAGIYAASPLWLPYVVASQLPSGWRLEELKSGYPGTSGININVLRVRGELGGVDLKVTAEDLHLVYQGFKTDIGQLTLDIFLHFGSDTSADPLTLDDLSLPVTRLTGQLPQLSVNRIDLGLHLAQDGQSPTDPPPLTIMLDMEAFKLTPAAGNRFHLESQLGFEDSVRLTGWLEVDAGPNAINAGIRFPSGNDSPWLAAQFDQEEKAGETATIIKATLNADLADRDWLDSVLARSTGRVITQLGGKIKLDANFAGQDLQGIKHLSLTSENLHFLSDRAMLNLDVGLLASRENGNIGIELTTPLKFAYQGATGWVHELLTGAVPGLQYAPAPQAVVIADLTRGSRLVISTGAEASLGLSGDVEFDLNSSSEHLKLKSAGLQVEIADMHNPDSVIIEGLVSLDWALKVPVTYTSENFQLTADTLSIASELVSRGGKLVSTGNGTLMQATLVQPAISTSNMDLTWQDLDLDSLTGKLSTRTQGLTIELDNQTWTGFDLDMNYTLLKKNDVNGGGKLVFTSGPELPIEFTGNAETMHWDVKLAPATIKLAKLRNLLSLAHVKLPASIKMTDGYIELRGNILFADEITANMLISGHDMVASIHKSRANKASFNFNAGYDKTLWANGPVSIEAFELAGGIDVKHIRSEIELADAEHFGLNNLYADVLDGQLELGSLRYSEKGIADTTARFNHINLEKLLAYADIDGLEGTGFLDIVLPVGSDQTGIHVQNGTFSSTGPGRLAYRKEGLADGNIGLRALENFQYQKLSGTFNYQSDGAYQMTVRLEGMNPDLYGGHAVVFNLNINGLLPAVFEAMFVTGSFEEAILNEIKSR